LNPSPKQYIDNTFNLASPNLSINGMPIASLDAMNSSLSTAGQKQQQPSTSYEPFDARLRARVEELTREEEDLLREIASLKRSTPAAAAAGWSDAFKRSVKEDEEALAARKSTSVEAEDGDKDYRTDAQRLVVDPLERQREVEGAYGRAVAGLGRLKREMPATVAKMERARSAGGYVVTGR
jgi:kinetochor protein Mis14/NSL1